MILTDVTNQRTITDTHLTAEYDFLKYLTTPFLLWALPVLLLIAFLTWFLMLRMYVRRKNDVRNF